MPGTGASGLSVSRACQSFHWVHLHPCSWSPCVAELGPAWSVVGPHRLNTSPFGFDHLSARSQLWPMTDQLPCSGVAQTTAESTCSLLLKNHDGKENASIVVFFFLLLPPDCDIVLLLKVAGMARKYYFGAKRAKIHRGGVLFGNTL